MQWHSYNYKRLKCSAYQRKLGPLLTKTVGLSEWPSVANAWQVNKQPRAEAHISPPALSSQAPPAAEGRGWRGELARLVRGQVGVSGIDLVCMFVNWQDWPQSSGFQPWWYNTPLYVSPIHFNVGLMQGPQCCHPLLMTEITVWNGLKRINCPVY